MPERKTMERVKADKLAGKAPSTQAGEFVKADARRALEFSGCRPGHANACCAIG
jgi:hypothetical protein